MKKKRIELANDSEKLAHNPLAALAGMAPENLPQNPPHHPEHDQPASHGKPWAVGRARKGAYDIRLERRAKGKHVTVLKNVSGDADALLKELKKRCGAGGVARDGAIELQGDHQAAVLEFLRGCGKP